MEYARIERKELNDLVKKYNKMLNSLRLIEIYADNPVKIKALVKIVTENEKIVFIKDLNIQPEEKCAYCKKEFPINKLYRFTNMDEVYFICGKCQEQGKVPTLR